MLEGRTWVIIAAWLFGLAAAAPPELPDALRQQIDLFLGRQRFTEAPLRRILESGAIQGNFDTAETLGVFHYLARHFPQFLKAKTIGSTVNGRDIEAFELAADGPNEHKAKALLAGTYHARELTCANFLVGALLRFTHHLLHESQDLSFLRFLTLVFVPIVNIDSHTHISDTFHASGAIPQKRKNMNAGFCA